MLILELGRSNLIELLLERHLEGVAGAPCAWAFLYSRQRLQAKKVSYQSIADVHVPPY